ncbi:hypothetical protein NC651_034583 [Populus alba x Populus x berolinensis]|nr:hypothetical protein NC651_034583 [Populus alba x Populus x berolinensis]
MVSVGPCLLLLHPRGMICWLLLLGCLGCVRLPLFQSLMGAGLRSCTAGLFMSCLVSSWGYSRDDDPCSAVFLLVGPRDAVWMYVFIIWFSCLFKGVCSLCF